MEKQQNTRKKNNHIDMLYEHIKVLRVCDLKLILINTKNGRRNLVTSPVKMTHTELTILKLLKENNLTTVPETHQEESVKETVSPESYAK